MRRVQAGVFVFLCSISMASFGADTAKKGGASKPRVGTESSMLAKALSLPQIKFFQMFWKWDVGYTYQCQGALGEQFALLNDWLPRIRINTDNGWGGCYQTFGIVDPSNALAHYTFSIDWEPEPGADAGQCGNPGKRNIPIVGHPTPAYFTPPIDINTDDRKLGCTQTWSITPDATVTTSDYEIDLLFYPDDEGIGQCGGTTASDPGSPITVKAGSSVTITIDTDGRYGGCQFSARLRKLSRP
jgi:hypothetical protein